MVLVAFPIFTSPRNKSTCFCLKIQGPISNSRTQCTNFKRRPNLFPTTSFGLPPPTRKFSNFSLLVCRSRKLWEEARKPSKFSKTTLPEESSQRINFAILWGSEFGSYFEEKVTLLSFGSPNLLACMLSAFCLLAIWATCLWGSPGEAPISEVRVPMRASCRKARQ